MMYYYTVEKIGDGTEENPFRPNYEGAFVWSENQCPTCARCLIATPQTVLDLRLVSVTDLEDACINRNLQKDDVVSWFVGGS